MAPNCFQHVFLKLLDMFAAGWNFQRIVADEVVFKRRCTFSAFSKFSALVLMFSMCTGKLCRWNLYKQCKKFKRAQAEYSWPLNMFVMNDGAKVLKSGGLVR